MAEGDDEGGGEVCDGDCVGGLGVLVFMFELPMSMSDEQGATTVAMVVGVQDGQMVFVTAEVTVTVLAVVSQGSFSQTVEYMADVVGLNCGISAKT
jgi:hypothetical protein